MISPSKILGRINAIIRMTKNKTITPSDAIVRIEKELLKLNLQESL